MKRLILYIAGVLFLAGCSTTKHLPEGEILYTGQKTMIVENRSTTPVGEIAMEEVEAALATAPNNSLLGSSSIRILYMPAARQSGPYGFIQIIINVPFIQIFFPTSLSKRNITARISLPDSMIHTCIIIIDCGDDSILHGFPHTCRNNLKPEILTNPTHQNNQRKNNPDGHGK